MDGPILPFDIVFLVLLTALAFVSVLGIGLQLTRPDPMQARLKAVLRERAALSQQQRAALEQPRRPARGAGPRGLMQKVVAQLRLQGDTTSRALRAKLAQAGWRGEAPVITYVFMRLFLPLAFGLFAALVVFGGRGIELAFNTRLLVVVVAVAVGYFFPAIILANAIQRRQHELRRGFPDALDLMVICVEAGLSLDSAFVRVTEEMEESYPILAEEFALTSAELAFLGDRRRALKRLASRANIADFHSLVTALRQAERYGTSLALTLRVLARENREARRNRALEKAGRLPATLTVPMMLFILPVLFIVLVGPAAIQTFRTLN